VWKVKQIQHHKEHFVSPAHHGQNRLKHEKLVKADSHSIYSSIIDKGCIKKGNPNLKCSCGFNTLTVRKIKVLGFEWHAPFLFHSKKKWPNTSRLKIVIRNHVLPYASLKLETEVTIF
jgi:hypothetical protein